MRVGIVAVIDVFNTQSSTLSNIYLQLPNNLCELYTDANNDNGKHSIQSILKQNAAKTNEIFIGVTWSNV